MIYIVLIALAFFFSEGGKSVHQEGLDFTDVSQKVGIPRVLPRPVSSTYGSFWADLNQDGWVDLIFMNHGLLPSLYLNKQGGHFTDRFNRSGIRSEKWLYPQQRDRHGGSCADYDNDGDLDLFFTHGAKRGETLGIKYDELLNNQGNFTFQEVSYEASTLNSQGRARLPTWIDYDNDRWLDLYIGNFKSPNVLYKNNGDGTFRDVSRKANLDLEKATLPAWFDYDGDGNVDVLVIWPPELYRNNGDGTFSNVTHQVGLNNRPVPSASGIALGDYDNDGDSDVFIVSRLSNGSRLYRNDHAIFTPIEGSFGPGENEEGTGAVWGDIDNDGDLDLIVAGSERLRYFENTGNTGFVARPLKTDVTFKPGKETDIALADYDNDGYLDLAVNAFERQFLLKNLHNGNSWLKIAFQGTTSNRMGLGVKIWAKLGDKRTIFREYMGDTGFSRSAGCGPLHIGLGESGSVSLRVLWPSGKEQRLEHIEVSQTVRIVEP